MKRNISLCFLFASSSSPTENIFAEKTFNQSTNINMTYFLSLNEKKIKQEHFLLLVLSLRQTQSRLLCFSFFLILVLKCCYANNIR